MMQKAPSLDEWLWHSLCWSSSEQDQENLFFCPGIVIPDCGGLCYFEQLSIQFDSVEVGSVDLLHEHLKWLCICWARGSDLQWRMSSSFAPIAANLSNVFLHLPFTAKSFNLCIFGSFCALVPTAETTGYAGFSFIFTRDWRFVRISSMLEGYYVFLLQWRARSSWEMALNSLHASLQAFKVLLEVLGSANQQLLKLLQVTFPFSPMLLSMSL